jgi:hypothetical protein
MPKPSPLRRHTKPCKHVHYSGHKCMERVSKLLTGLYPDPVLCRPHREQPCADCEAMARAFPLPNGRILGADK